MSQVYVEIVTECIQLSVPVWEFLFIPSTFQCPLNWLCPHVWPIPSLHLCPSYDVLMPPLWATKETLPSPVTVFHTDQCTCWGVCWEWSRVTHTAETHNQRFTGRSKGKRRYSASQVNNNELVGSLGSEDASVLISGMNCCPPFYLQLHIYWSGVRFVLKDILWGFWNREDHS